MDLSIYDVIKSPSVTTRSQYLGRELGKLVFEVHVKANKPMISAALKQIFGLEVLSVRTILVKGKRRRRGKFFGVGPARKKAIITTRPKGKGKEEVVSADVSSLQPGKVVAKDKS